MGERRQTEDETTMASSKKRKEKKKDFAKSKLKLGTGKLQANNATNTSFSSRSIALGQQHIGQEHKDAPTTKRNLTLEDLQTQLKHYSASTRKDALAGLRELLTAFPEQLLYSSISTLVPSLARLIGDEEASVRKALLAFLSWYLPTLPPLLLQPHHSILVFFVTSALSHIFPDVRLDAVRTLNILLDVCPDSITLDWDAMDGPSTSASAGEQSHSHRVLECYLALLHIRSGIVTNGLKTDMSPASKALVLASLAKFLRLSLAPEGTLTREEQDEQAWPTVTTWFMASSVATPRDYEAFVNLVNRSDFDEEDAVMLKDGRHDTASSSLYLPSGLLDGGDLLSLGGINDIASELLQDRQHASSDSASGSVPSDPQNLLQVLLPVLLSAFLDSAPSAFSPASTSTASSSSNNTLDIPLDTVVAVTEIARDLWRALLARQSAQIAAQAGAAPTKAFNDISRGLEKLVGHMGAYFPFGSDELGRKTNGADGKLQNLNIAYCELVSLLFLTAQTSDAPSSKRSSHSNAKSELRAAASSGRLSAQLSHVKRYIAGLMANSKTAVLPLSGPTLNPHTYIELLPSIWSLLLASSAVREEAEEPILHTLVRHFISLSATSGVKKVAFEFISETVVLQDLPAYTGSFTLRHRMMAKDTAQLMDDMVVSLPRYLWELGNRDERMTYSVLHYLQYLARTSALTNAVKAKVGDYLVPYFVSQHATKGVIQGPFLKLRSTSLQVAALETMWWLAKTGTEDAALPLKLLEAVDLAVELCKDEAVKNKWMCLRSSM